MPYDEFLRRLQRLGLSPTDYTELAGVSRNTTYNWRTRGIPRWALTILDQAETIEFQREAIREFRRIIGETWDHASELADFNQMEVAQ